MKRSLTFLSVLAVIAIMSGCSASKPETPQRKLPLPEVQTECKLNGEDLPLWVCVNPENDDFITALGNSKIHRSLGVGFAIKEATLDARANLVSRLSSKVSNQTEIETKINDSETNHKVHSFSQHDAENSVKDVPAIAVFQSKDETVYVLVQFAR